MTSSKIYRGGSVYQIRIYIATTLYNITIDQTNATRRKLFMTVRLHHNSVISTYHNNHVDMPVIMTVTVMTLRIKSDNYHRGNVMNIG